MKLNEVRKTVSQIKANLFKNSNSFSIGMLTNFKEWNVDVNNTFGRNNFHYFIKNTLNATLEDNSPTEFDAGGHQLIQNTTSIDFSKYFNSM